MQHDEQQHELNGQSATARTPAESPVPRFLLRRREAASACGVSAASWDRLVSAGKTPAPIRLGKRLVWRVAELAAWVEAGCPPRAEWDALKRTQRK